MFRFSTRRMLLAIALIAIGTGLLTAPENFYPRDRVSYVSLMFTAAALVGAGFGAFYHNLTEGMTIGAVVGVIIMLFIPN